jgi:hypothetical protein
LLADLRNVVPDSMDHASDKIIDPPSKSSKKVTQAKGQARALINTLGEEIQKAKGEVRDESSPNYLDFRSDTRSSDIISKQDVVYDASNASMPDQTGVDTADLSASLSAKVDDDAVSLLLSSVHGDSNPRDLDSFLKGKMEHDQHRLEIQQRAKKLLQDVDVAETRNGGWKASIMVEDEEHDEEASLLNTDQPDRAWGADPEGCDILEETGDDLEHALIPPRRSPRRSREAADSPRPRSCESGPAGDDAAEQAGGLAALKGTVAASLSMLRRDLLPLKMPIGNIGDDSPRWGGLMQAARKVPNGPAGDDSPSRGGGAAPSARPAQREEPLQGASRPEPAGRNSGAGDAGEKTGFALLRNSLAILKEDLGLGPR